MKHIFRLKKRIILFTLILFFVEWVQYLGTMKSQLSILEHRLIDQLFIHTIIKLTLANHHMRAVLRH